MARILSTWCKEAKKAMIDKDMDTQNLAEQLGCTRQFIAAIVNGRQMSPDMAVRISEILDIKSPIGQTTYTYK